MATRPSGTVTFLFTDIEGSTARWEQHQAAMQQALPRHDALVRASIEAHGGAVFKTVGDAFCAAFPTAPAAALAALAAQRALAREPWPDTLGALRVRMALHTGTADERDGDYFGPTLNRVARLMAAAHGGQILLSVATYELLRDHLPPDVRLADLGRHRLKDLLRAEQIFQLTAPALRAEFPPPKTLASHPQNLPQQRAPLLGREREVQDLLALLRRPEVGLVTLTGPGGTGKTRLALQVGAELLDDCADGVWFVDLAPLTDPALVVPAIAQTLGIAEAGQQPLVDVVSAELHAKQPLLILDNFEQIVPAAEQLAPVLAAAPQLKLLVTSRVPLRLYGEHEFPVPPLALPDPQRPPPPAQLSQYSAVALFIARAQAVKPDFQVTNATAPAVAEICRRLDGLPLAIELAAARVKLFSPPTLLQRLEQRLTLLTGGARDIPARQQTIRSAIDWSYQLLTAAEQTLFARLGVFSGGCTIAAIEAVCYGDARLALDPVDGVAALVDHSLLRADEDAAGELRFGMLETIHEYARDRLAAAGEREALQRQHAAWCLALAAAAVPVMEGDQPRPAMQLVETERDNLQAATAWALDHAEWTTALQLTSALGDFCYAAGYVTEGRRLLDAAVARTGPLHRADLSPPAARYRAKVFGEAGWFALLQGDLDRARELSEQGVELYRTVDDANGQAWALHRVASVAGEAGEYARARALDEAALAQYRALGNRDKIATMLNDMGWLEFAAGDLPRAQDLLEASLALYRALQNNNGLCWTLSSLGVVMLAAGATERARTLLHESLLLAQQQGLKVVIASCLDGLAMLAARPHSAERPGAAHGRRAAQLWGAAAMQRQATGVVLSPTDQAMVGPEIVAARALVDQATWDAAWAAGQALTLDEAVALALEPTGDV